MMKLLINILLAGVIGASMAGCAAIGPVAGVAAGVLLEVAACEIAPSLCDEPVQADAVEPEPKG